jgi:hypothetical protein
MCSVLFALSSLGRPACDQPVDRQQDYRAEGRYENGPEAYLRYPWAPEEALDYETAYECSRYTDQDSDYDSPGVRPWHNPLGQYAGYEPDHYQRYYTYALSPPPYIHYSLPPDDTRKRNITDAVPDATIALFTLHSARINTCGPGYVRDSRPCNAGHTKASAKSRAAP